MTSPGLSSRAQRGILMRAGLVVMAALTRIGQALGAKKLPDGS